MGCRKTSRNEPASEWGGMDRIKLILFYNRAAHRPWNFESIVRSVLMYLSISRYMQFSSSLHEFPLGIQCSELQSHCFLYGSRTSAYLTMHATLQVMKKGSVGGQDHHDVHGRFEPPKGPPSFMSFTSRRREGWGRCECTCTRTCIITRSRTSSSIQHTCTVVVVKTVNNFTVRVFPPNHM